MFVNLTTYPSLSDAPNVADDIQMATQIVNDVCSSLIEPPIADASYEEMDNWVQEQFALAASKEPEHQSSAAILMALTYKGVVTLPFSAPLFDFDPSIFGFPVPQLFAEADEFVAGLKPMWQHKKTHLKILFSTDCRTASTFDIDAFSELHDLLLADFPEQINEHGKFGKRKRPSGALPVYALLKVIEECDSSALSEYHRHGYMIWRADRDDQVTFEEFISDPKNLEGRVASNGKFRERVLMEAELKARLVRSSNLRAARQAQNPAKPFVQNLIDIAAEDSEDSPERYFQSLRGGGAHMGFRPVDWLHNPVGYPGLDDFNIVELGKFWMPAFNGYLKQRRIHKKYEKEKDSVRAIFALADYLFAYLPLNRPGTSRHSTA